MQMTCVGEVTAGYEISVAEHIKQKLFPGEKIRIKIEPINEKEESKRLKAIERLKKTGKNSKLGLYNPIIQREDAHERESSL